jgi:hypothetical protein
LKSNTLFSLHLSHVFRHMIRVVPQYSLDGAQLEQRYQSQIKIGSCHFSSQSAHSSNCTLSSYHLQLTTVNQNTAPTPFLLMTLLVPHSTPGLSNAAPVINFPGALFYPAGFNVNQNFKEKIFLNNRMFQFFS